MEMVWRGGGAMSRRQQDAEPARRLWNRENLYAVSLCLLLLALLILSTDSAPQWIYQGF